MLLRVVMPVLQMCSSSHQSRAVTSHAAVLQAQSQPTSTSPPATITPQHTRKAAHLAGLSMPAAGAAAPGLQRACVASINLRSLSLLSSSSEPAWPASMAATSSSACAARR
jgi:hypothetical protein